MLSTTAMETLVHDRQRTLLDEAARRQLLRDYRAGNPTPRRRQAGWLLVRAGARLAHAEMVRTSRSTVQIVAPG